MVTCDEGRSQRLQSKGEPWLLMWSRSTVTAWTLCAERGLSSSSVLLSREQLCPPGDIWPSQETFSFFITGRVSLLLESVGRAEMLLNILQDTAHPPLPRIVRSKMSTVPPLRNPRCGSGHCPTGLLLLLLSSPSQPRPFRPGSDPAPFLRGITQQEVQSTATTLLSKGHHPNPNLSLS